MKALTIKEYAIEYGVSKQSVYGKIQRGSLKTDTREGVKYILIGDKTVSTPIENVEQPLNNDIENKCLKKVEKTLKKLNNIKHKLKIRDNTIESLEKLLKSKDSEIETLKRSLGLVTMAIENKLLQKPKDVQEAEIINKKKKKGKK